MQGETEGFDALKLRNQVCFPLYACSKELVRQYGPYLKELNLTYTQYIVMMVLWENETVSSRELAECLHLDYGTLTPRLTEEGRKLKEKAVAIPPAVAECMGLTAEEFGALYVLTYKALRHMEGSRTEEK